MIGRADHPDRLPDVHIPMGADITAARQTAVYLAANMKSGFNVALSGDGFPIIMLESGRPLTAKEYATVHDGEL